jgi:hypothetical protein
MTRKNWRNSRRRKNVRARRTGPPWGSGRRLRKSLGSVTLVSGLLVVTSGGVSITGRPAGLVRGHGGLIAIPAIVNRAGRPGADGGNPVNLAPPPIPPVELPRRGASSPSIPPVDLLPWADIPKTVLAAYQRAASDVATSDPGCHLPVALLAGIGEVESGQADGGAVDGAGTTLEPILGPVLDGQDGYAAIPNTYGTQWDQGGAWARAVGPMQFIPSTWAAWGAGGNPNNVNDAALAAARYLCSGGQDLATPAGLRSAIESYNDSYQYLATVLQWMSVYSGRIIPVPDSPFMTMAAGTANSPAGTSPGATVHRLGKTTAGSGKAAPEPAPKPATSGGPAPAPSPVKTPAPAPSPVKTPVPAGTGSSLLSPVDHTIQGATQVVNGLLPSL